MHTVALVLQMFVNVASTDCFLSNSNFISSNIDLVRDLQHFLIALIITFLHLHNGWSIFVHTFFGYSNDRKSTNVESTNLVSLWSGVGRLRGGTSHNRPWSPSFSNASCSDCDGKHCELDAAVYYQQLEASRE